MTTVGVRQSLESRLEEIHGVAIVREGERSALSSRYLCGLLEGVEAREQASEVCRALMCPLVQRLPMCRVLDKLALVSKHGVAFS